MIAASRGASIETMQLLLDSGAAASINDKNMVAPFTLILKCCCDGSWWKTELDLSSVHMPHRWTLFLPSSSSPPGAGPPFHSLPNHSLLLRLCDSTPFVTGWEVGADVGRGECIEPGGGQAPAGPQSRRHRRRR
jgi:hypothetical protein